MARRVPQRPGRIPASTPPQSAQLPQVGTVFGLRFVALLEGIFLPGFSVWTACFWSRHRSERRVSATNQQDSVQLLTPDYGLGLDAMGPRGPATTVVKAKAKPSAGLKRRIMTPT